MATRASSTAINVQKLLSGAAQLEVKLLNAGVETARVYLNQAARFSSLADDTLKAIQDDKATLGDTARRLTDFGRQNVQAFADLSRRLGASYYDELDRLADAALKSRKSPEPAPAPTRKASPPAARKRTRR
ncbi:MAG: hypothetical protein ACM3PU_15090 [Gemmatimonadota bacterium]